MGQIINILCLGQATVIVVFIGREFSVCYAVTIQYCSYELK